MTICLLPNKFLCYFPLKIGAYVVGILNCCIVAIIAIVLLLQVLDVASIRYRYPWVNAYAALVVGCVDSSFMVAVGVWFLFGVTLEQSSVILVWLVATLLWLAHAFIMTIVLLITYIVIYNIFLWILCLVLALIAFGIAAYAYITVYAYWLQLRKAKVDAEVAGRSR